MRQGGTLFVCVHVCLPFPVHCVSCVCVCVRAHVEGAPSLQRDSVKDSAWIRYIKGNLTVVRTHKPNNTHTQTHTYACTHTHTSKASLLHSVLYLEF